MQAQAQAQAQGDIYYSFRKLNFVSLFDSVKKASAARSQCSESAVDHTSYTNDQHTEECLAFKLVFEKCALCKQIGDTLDAIRLKTGNLCGALASRGVRNV